LLAEQITIRPQKGPQEAFLASEADIVVFGGAAGGGKSYGLLLEPLRHIDNPRFGAVLIRRSYPEITKQGGLWDESFNLYPHFGAMPNRGGLFWTFPSGARVSFCHLASDQELPSWHGAQIPLIGFDELPEFSERQFFYLLTRNRSTCGVRPYMRATCNPDADSWVARFIAWWIDQESGFAIPERAGVLRWMVRINEEIIWADSRQELEDRYRLPDGQPIPPKSVTFIPSKLSDNPILMRSDPGYLANLMAQPLVERERLLGGNWKIRPAAGKVFNRAWFDIVDQVPSGGVECLFWDFAATAKELSGPEPCYTAGVSMRCVNGVYYVTDCVAEQLGPAAVEALFLGKSRQVATHVIQSGARFMLRWEIEPGSAAKRDNYRLVQMMAGIDAGGVHPQGDKMVRARALAAQALVRNIKLLRGPWNERWLTHMHHQPECKKTDIMDASSGSFNCLTAIATNTIHGPLVTSANLHDLADREQTVQIGGHTVKLYDDDDDYDIKNNWWK
jgi:predicted phage terminase large subunit-like protein